MITRMMMMKTYNIKVMIGIDLITVSLSLSTMKMITRMIMDEVLQYYDDQPDHSVTQLVHHLPQPDMLQALQGVHNPLVDHSDIL